MDIPSTGAHRDYISCMKQFYLRNLEAIKQKSPPATLEAEEEEVSLHFALEFRKLKDIVNEDYFEWNHAIFCSIVYFSYQEQMTPEVDQQFVKQYHLLPIEDNLADLILLMHHIDQKWSCLALTELSKFKSYIKKVHSALAKYVGYADDLSKFNRWNIIHYLKPHFFRLSTDGLMYIACRTAYHLRYLHIGSLMAQHLGANVEIPENEVQQLRQWCKGQETYFSIRKFRMRMSDILWNFFNDEPSRCYYTYTRSGEVPTILAHVTQSFPSAWISGLQHELLYEKAENLINHVNTHIQNAVLIALFEAHFKTHYNIAWSRYCMCMEDDILKVYRQLQTVEHPMILKIWGKFYVMWQGNLVLMHRFEKAIVYWLKLLKEHCNASLFRNVNLSNTINRILPEERGPEKTDNDIFEISL
ncbi:MAG: hypothetical protein CBC48_07200 [bacterium TMED88]|nr:MAG: hypothetical protein CBC48_07200 [bacterium TMED88]